MAETASCDCPTIDDADWHRKEHVLADRHFYSKVQWNLFHMSLNFSSALSGAVAGADPGDRCVVSFGDARFVTWVFAEPRRWLSRGVRDLVAYLRSSLKAHPRQLFFWYTTCPVCSKERGYKTVIFARLEQRAEAKPPGGEVHRG